MAKHFVLDSAKKEVKKEDLVRNQKETELVVMASSEERRQRSRAKLLETESLKHVHGKVIVKVDVNYKNSHRLETGQDMLIQRGYNNFNRRESQPINAIVISGDDIPAGSEILINHNSLHDTNKILDYQPLSGAAEATDVRYFSVPEDECYAWIDENGNPQPIKNFEFGLRVFRPYGGSLIGIEPTLLTDTLYVTTGELKGLVVRTLKACDYVIIWQGKDGREKQTLRFRHSPDDNYEKEEVICIDNSLTEQVNSGNLLVGLTPTDAKSI